MTTTAPKKYRFQTREFTNNADGQRKKMETIQSLEQLGWEVADETLQSAQFSGVKACCWAIICFPVAFTAYKNGQIVVTLRKPL